MDSPPLKPLDMRLENLVPGWAAVSQGGFHAGSAQVLGGPGAVTCHKHLGYCFSLTLIVFYLLVFNANFQLHK